ncbi:MAG: ribosome silencing factor [Eubacterium sp.]|nr:ribosome silencing factor [Eubacterium sp.]
MGDYSIEEKMVKCAVDALLDKMAHDVVSLKVGNVTVITDYFILATANSGSQLDAMIDGAEEAMKNDGYTLYRREGRSNSGWVLLDYGEVVIHLFTKEMREFYNLDGSWRDAPKQSY